MRQGLPLSNDLDKDSYRLYEGVDYQQFWAGRQKQILDEHEHAIVRLLLPATGSRIVDIGCGYGRLADCYMDRFEQVIMVDGAMSLLREAYKRTKGKAVYIASDLNRLPFHPASFDAILMIRVFHHVDHSQTCITEFNRLLCSDGRLIFNYCNKQNAQRVVRWLIGASSSNPFKRGTEGLGSTFISHHPKEIQEMLDEAGFINIRYYGIGVMDQLAGKIAFIGKQIGLSMLLAPFFAWSRMAPWILCQAQAKGAQRLHETERITDLLQCPSCGGIITEEQNGYRCEPCRKFYPIEDGIIDLRVSDKLIGGNDGHG